MRHAGALGIGSWTFVCSPLFGPPVGPAPSR